MYNINITDWVNLIVQGDRTAISKALTLMESNLAEDKLKADELLKSIDANHLKKSIRIGITGAPGVGKSSLINQLGPYFVRQFGKLAVLSIDPSSQISGGSIMGDKSRMNKLVNDPNVFVRPGNTANELGGTNRNTHSSIKILEAAGFQTIIVETVGVGQSEIDVVNISDIVLCLIQPGSGDELQALKRGIMEWGDLYIICKDDGELEVSAKKSLMEIQSILNINSRQGNKLPVKAIKISIKKEDSVLNLFNYIVDFINILNTDNLKEINRNEKNARYFKHHWIDTLKIQFENNPIFNDTLNEILKEIKLGKFSIESGIKKLNKFIFAELFKKG